MCGCGTKVEQNLETPPMGLRQQAVEVCQRPQSVDRRRNSGDVIAESTIATVNWRDPDRVDPKVDR